MLGLNLWEIKKTKTVPKIVNESKSEPNKLWVDQGKQFDNNSM